MTHTRTLQKPYCEEAVPHTAPESYIGRPRADSPPICRAFKDLTPSLRKHFHRVKSFPKSFSGSDLHVAKRQIIAAHTASVSPIAIGSAAFTGRPTEWLLIALSHDAWEDQPIASANYVAACSFSPTVVDACPTPIAAACSFVH